MNYIPGFSNYLEASVPEYADGGAVMGDPRRAAVMPMTQEGVAPNYLSGLNLSDADLASLYALSSSGNFNQGNYGSDFGSLDNVYGMNFGSDFGGGLQGGSLFKVNPYLQTLQAPLSDKGNPTAYGGGIEVKSPTQTFRLLDKNTGQVVYEGVGYEGAQEAIDRASALTAKEGAKAQWQIQTPNSQQASGYSTVANEKRSQSTLGDIASVALPVGMALLTGGLSLPAQMAAAGIAGAAGAGLAGKDPLKAGLISAGTAGLMSGSGASDAIGRAVGNVGGTLLGKTAEEVAKQAAAEASGQIVVTGLSKALQGAGSAIGNTLLSQGIKGGLSEVTGFKTPAERFADQPSSIADPVAPYDGLTVTGSKLVSGSGSPFGAAVSIPVNEMLSGALTATQPTQQTKTAEDIEAERNPMVVTGMETLTPDEILLALSGVGGLTAATAGNVGSTAANQAKTAEDIEAEKNPMVVTGMETLTPDEILLALGGVGGLAAATAGGGAPTDPAAEKAKADAEAKKKFDLAEALRLAGLAAGVVGNVGKGGGGQTGYYGGTGTGRLNPTFSAKLPAVGGLGNIGAARTKRELGDVDWLTYGTRPELSFFDYARPATPAPVTTPVPGNPAGPIMVTEENPRMAEGGAFSAKRGGRSRRTEFAVNGAGTGRSDDIPAVLSDGEYVIDAETVALLGDGSSKAGAKKLDELRVKVRKHKGQKLAKGRFSANAKRPEAYLSGGRI
jgi:hypothetical protein